MPDLMVALEVLKLSRPGTLNSIYFCLLRITRAFLLEELKELKKMKVEKDQKKKVKKKEKSKK